MQFLDSRTAFGYDPRRDRGASFMMRVFGLLLLTLLLSSSAMAQTMIDVGIDVSSQGVATLPFENADGEKLQAVGYRITRAIDANTAEIETISLGDAADDYSQSFVPVTMTVSFTTPIGPEGSLGILFGGDRVQGMLLEAGAGENGYQVFLGTGFRIPFESILDRTPGHSYLGLDVGGTYLQTWSQKPRKYAGVQADFNFFILKLSAGLLRRVGGDPGDSWAFVGGVGISWLAHR
jgi:hypothetical protein